MRLRQLCETGPAAEQGGIRISRDKDNPKSHNLYVRGSEAGSMTAGGNDRRVAEEWFPGVVGTDETVARISGISIDDHLHGYGLGQLLYLRVFDRGGADWYYNSQTYQPATNALKSLASKGFIEIHWHPREPDWDEDGGIHLVRITDRGRQAYRRGAMVKKRELRSHTGTEPK